MENIELLSQKKYLITDLKKKVYNITLTLQIVSILTLVKIMVIKVAINHAKILWKKNVLYLKFHPTSVMDAIKSLIADFLNIITELKMPIVNMNLLDQNLELA